MKVSVLRNFWDKEPAESTLEAMVEAIRTDRRTRELTEGYRQQHLEMLKNESMLFALALQLVGAGITQKLSTVALGRAFVEQGYERRTYQHTRGYIVVRRSAEEMRMIRYVMAHEATPEAPPAT